MSETPHISIDQSFSSLKELFQKLSSNLGLVYNDTDHIMSSEYDNTEAKQIQQGLINDLFWKNSAKNSTQQDHYKNLPELKLSKFHPYTKINIEEEKINFLSEVNNIKNALRQFITYNVSNKTPEEQKLLTLLQMLKEKSSTESQLNQITDGLKGCRNIASDYLSTIYSVQKNVENNSPDNSISGEGMILEDKHTFENISVGSKTVGAKLQIICSKLKELGEQFSLFIDVDELLEAIEKELHSNGDPPSTNEILATVSCGSFNLDFTIGPDGNIVSIKLVNFLEGKEVNNPVVDSDLTSTAQVGDWHKIENSIDNFTKLDKLRKSHPESNVHAAVHEMYADVWNLVEQQPDPEIKLPQYCCEGFNIHFYSIPDPETGLRQQFNMLLDIEEGKIDRKLALSSHFQEPVTWSEPVKLRFVLRLAHSLILTSNSLSQLTVYENLDAQSQLVNNLSRALPIHLLLGYNMSKNIEFNGENIPALVVDRILFSHPSQLFNIIHILRQQICFNRLLNSCFADNTSEPNRNKKRKLNDSSSDFSQKTSFELYTSYKDNVYLISLTFLPPESTHLVCLELFIALNAEITCKWNTYAEKKFSADDHCTLKIVEQLKQHLSIPKFLDSKFGVQ